MWGVLVSALHKVSPLGGDPCCSGLVRAPASMDLESEAEEVLFGFLICLGSQFKADLGPPTCAGHSQPVGPRGDVRAGVFIQVLFVSAYSLVEGEPHTLK